MRILLSALTCVKGDPEANLATHEQRLRRAAEQGCRLVVFPEMSLSGSLDPRSRWDRLLTLDSPPVTRLLALTERYGVAAVAGLAERSTAEDGGPESAYITQIVADGGRLVARYRKRHLGEGEEGFVVGSESVVAAVDDLRFGLAICAESGVDFPFDEPAAAGATAILYGAAPGLWGRRDDDEGFRRGLAWWESAGLADVRRHAARTATWIAVATQAGVTEDEDFPGLAALVDPHGEVVDRLPDWRPGDLVVDLPVDRAQG